ncbi:MAG: DHA2 family efflux MFS transporter permease subunit [Desulfovibrio fairfieldensis]
MQASRLAHSAASPKPALACYPPEKRGLALSLWAMVVVLAPILGPILGGWICDNYHWGWIFFVNVPVGALGLLLLRAPLHGRETPTGKAPIDVVGLVLLVVGIGCLQLMLDEGKDNDWFASGYIVTLGVAAVVGIAFFIAWELTEKHPVVNLSLFRHRNFTVGTICISLGFLLYFASVVLLPLMLQARLSYTAMWAGFSLAPVGVFPLIISPILGKQARRLDMRLMACLSFLVFAGCFFWRAGSTPGMDFFSVALPQLILGIGVALFFMPLTTIILSGLPNSDLAAASSLSNCVRIGWFHRLIPGHDHVGAARSPAPCPADRGHQRLQPGLGHGPARPGTARHDRLPGQGLDRQ